jgi:hypothetical protein
MEETRGKITQKRGKENQTKQNKQKKEKNTETYVVHKKI